LHKIIYGSRTVLYMFTAFFACFAIYDITALDSYVVALVLMVLLVVLSFTSVQLGHFLRAKASDVDSKILRITTHYDRATHAAVELSHLARSTDKDPEERVTTNPILASKQKAVAERIKAERTM
jgi:hypothetical protein